MLTPLPGLGTPHASDPHLSPDCTMLYLELAGAEPNRRLATSGLTTQGARDTRAPDRPPEGQPNASARASRRPPPSLPWNTFTYVARSTATVWPTRSAISASGQRPLSCRAVTCAMDARKKYNDAPELRLQLDGAAPIGASAPHPERTETQNFT